MSRSYELNTAPAASASSFAKTVLVNLMRLLNNALTHQMFTVVLNKGIHRQLVLTRNTFHPRQELRTAGRTPSRDKLKRVHRNQIVNCCVSSFCLPVILVLVHTFSVAMIQAYMKILVH